MVGKTIQPETPRPKVLLLITIQFMSPSLDLNCDLGELPSLDVEAAVMPYITSANIACGLHAGGAETMRAVVRLAKQHGVAVGAHPSWPDREHFGRREMSLPLEDVEALVWYQVGALAAIARGEGAELRHVKPHGALYHQAARDATLAETIVRAVKRFSQELIVVGLAGSVLVEAARALGLMAADEAFPDRRYNPDGTLVPRGQPGAVLQNPAQVAAHAVRLARAGIRQGAATLFPHTLCLHGDSPHAVQNARAVRAALEAAGIPVRGLTS